MATAIPVARMTLAEFVAWSGRPDNVDRVLELDRGRVVEVPPPKSGHGVFNWIAIAILTDYVRRRGSGFLLTNDTGIVVERDPDTLRGADIILFLRPLTPDDMAPRYVEDRPDLIVEILSSSDRPNQVTRRINQYLGRGIPLVWVIDPEDQTVAVYRPDELPKTLDESDDLTGNGVLPDFRCRVADLFALPGQPPAPPAP